MSEKPKIKVTVKPVKPPKPAKSIRKQPIKVNVSIKECPEYEIFRQCRKKGIVIRGNTRNLEKILEYRRTGVYKYDDSHYARRYLDHFLCKIGCSNGQCRSKPVNDSDCVTSCHYTAIPQSHYFEVTEAGRIYAYDIRTLNSEESLFNQFTHTPLDQTNQERFRRKVKWMEKYGYPTKFTETEDRELSVEQLTTNVINHINRHHYINRLWFDQLDMRGLKELYANLHDIWTYRLDLTDEVKVDLMPPDGIFCPNADLVQSYTEQMEDKLRREILIFVDKLTQNRVGAIYFMLGLVLVSEDAATSYPELYHTAYPDEDD